MSVNSINNYSTTGTTGTTSSSSTSSDNSTLTMDDFFQLMVAQLSNQDMYNTVDNTEYIAQMAQFSMVQALADLSTASATTYGVSLIGKQVSIAETASDGTTGYISGVVDGVNLYNGSAKVVVNGSSYDLKNVMLVTEAETTTTK